MKKITKVLIVLLSIIVVSSVAGYAYFQFYLKPVVVEDALVKVQNVLNDEEVQKQVDTFVQEMVDSGELDLEEIQGYTAYVEEKNKSTATPVESVIPAESIAPTENITATKKPQTKAPETVKPQNVATQSVAPQSVAPQTITPTQTIAPTEEPKKSDSLFDRIKSAMTADEFSFSMSMYNKLDMSYVMANMNSNREEVKEYVKSKLTSSEISKSLEIYAKYSYILK